MAKKWRTYSWTTSANADEKITNNEVANGGGGEERENDELQVDCCRLGRRSIAIEDEEEDEEIDVVTVQQNCESKLILTTYHDESSQSNRRENNETSMVTPVLVQSISGNCDGNSVIEHTPMRQMRPILSMPPMPPAHNYYQTTAEDYPNTSAATENAAESNRCHHHVLSNVPSVIQQHTSHPTPQIRLTSVIHHSGSFISQNNASNVQQNSQSTMHTASPIQPQSAWGPSSPTEGATAPSPPPHIQHSSESDMTTIHYNGYTSTADISHYTAYLPGESATANSSPSYVTLQTPSESAQPSNSVRTRSLAMCFTSTGAALSLPPKKKDIYRPYSLDDRPSVRWRPAEDLTAAHAILDLSASPPAPLAPLQPTSPSSPKQQPSNSQTQSSLQQSPTSTVLASVTATAKPMPSKTIAYTYEAFFVSDGRSKKKTLPNGITGGTVPTTTLTNGGGSGSSGGGGGGSGSGGGCGASNDSVVGTIGVELRPKYTCSECGKQYATSSNLSRHKQTHRSLDSQSAKKCVTCGKAYVSMPALAMHLLTHKLNHACGICGKLFSRPWLLQGHLRSHTGEKPYGCAHCGKAFADRSNLRAHMQTHSTDKNFECTRCRKTFALKSYLNKHLESACIGENGAAVADCTSNGNSNTSSNTSTSSTRNNAAIVAITNQVVPTITHLR